MRNAHVMTSQKIQSNIESSEIFPACQLGNTGARFENSNTCADRGNIWRSWLVYEWSNHNLREA